MSLEIVILAAGMGKRMHSRLPKVLQLLAGRPLLFHVLQTAAALKPERIHVVLGHGAEAVEAFLAGLPEPLRALTKSCRQKEQLGTAHAVMQALPLISPQSLVLVLYGDTPLAPAALLAPLCAPGAEETALRVLSAEHPTPYGYGRIVRDAAGELLGIVEEKDADERIRALHEINTGIICAPAAILNQYLPRIGNHNAQGEYYLTDLAGLLVEDKKRVEIVKADDYTLLEGVNSPAQLAGVERIYQRLEARRLLEKGVRLADPERFDLRGSLNCGQDVFIDINCVFIGEVSLGNHVEIGPGCVITDSVIGDDCVISPYTVMTGATLARAATVGPFARLRPGSRLEAEAHLGNFVETKNAHLGPGTKAGHLSYLGDAEIGRDVNIGAGTITCNYDGAAKHQTVIGDDVFVGSDTQLVAPVTVASGVTIGAGTTLTAHEQVPENGLVITRAKARVFPIYARPRKAGKS